MKTLDDYGQKRPKNQKLGDILKEISARHRGSPFAAFDAMHAKIKELSAGQPARDGSLVAILRGDQPTKEKAKAPDGSLLKEMLADARSGPQGLNLINNLFQSNQAYGRNKR